MVYIKENGKDYQNIYVEEIIDYCYQGLYKKFGELQQKEVQ